MNHLKYVTKYLDKQGVEYEVLHHEPAYTAQETAQAQHVPGREMIKNVIVKGAEGYVMCVLSADRKLDFDSVETHCGKGPWHLATEEELAELFPECDLGAEPPFCDLPVYVDRVLEKDEYIVFNAGTHTDTVRMRFTDWKALAHPKLASLSSSVE